MVPEQPPVEPSADTDASNDEETPLETRVDGIVVAAFAINGLVGCSALLFCVVGIVLSVIVDHIGILAMLQGPSAWLFNHLHIAAVIFAISTLILCVITLASNTLAYVVIYLVVLTGIVAIGYALSSAASFGWAWLMEAVDSWAVDSWAVDSWAVDSGALASSAKFVWWIVCGGSGLLLCGYAISTTARTWRGVIIAVIVPSIGVASWFITTALSAMFATPWATFFTALACGFTVLTVGLSACRPLIYEFAIDRRIHDTFLAWLMVVVGGAALSAINGTWQFVRDGLAIATWWETTLYCGGLLAGISILGLLGIGTVVAITLPDEETLPDDD